MLVVKPAEKPSKRKLKLREGKVKIKDKGKMKGGGDKQPLKQL